MRRRPAIGLRLLVASLVLASLGVQQTPAHAVAAIGRHAAALAPSGAVGETLALPSGRADGQLAIEQRERAPVPLVSLGDAAARVRPQPCTLQSVAPRARSHPIRRVHRASEDPPPH
jgi:hypothetical protein